MYIKSNRYNLKLYDLYYENCFYASYYITCRVPNIELENSRGLSHQQVAVLYAELVELTKQLQGEVMIFELTQHVQKYLHENNKPSYSSFYEEMVSRRQEKIEYEMLEKQLKEDKERQVRYVYYINHIVIK